MKDIPLLGPVLAAMIALILVSVFFWGTKTSDEFKKVCDEAHGTVVYDGRQYQCIKP